MLLVSHTRTFVLSRYSFTQRVLSLGTGTPNNDGRTAWDQGGVWGLVALAARL